MTDFTDNLWSDLMREHRSTLAHTERPERGRVARLHPRAIAGSSLGLAGVGAALVLALGGSTAAPALAVTTQQDGSVLVHESTHSSGPWLQAANAKLTALGTDEQILVNYARGAATTPGPVSCTPLGGVNTPSGPPVKVLLGSDGTQVVPGGTTGAGTVHLSSCVVFKTPVPGGGGTGNTGAN